MLEGIASPKTRLVLAVLLGIGTVGYGGYSYLSQTSALESSVTVEATIIETSIEKNTGRGVDYTPHATFRYAYQDETYRSSNVFPGPLPRTFGSREKVRAKFDGIEAGDRVRAYVPKDDPENAYLKRSSSTKPLLVMGVGVISLLGAGRSWLAS